LASQTSYINGAEQVFAEHGLFNMTESQTLYLDDLKLAEEWVAQGHSLKEKKLFKATFAGMAPPGQESKELFDFHFLCLDLFKDCGAGHTYTFPILQRLCMYQNSLHY
jgi:hypothetical protein